jgi:hypothetical protein
LFSRDFILRFHIEVTGIMTLVKLAREGTASEIDLSPTSDDWPGEELIGPPHDVLVVLHRQEIVRLAAVSRRMALERRRGKSPLAIESIDDRYGHHRC